MRVVQLRTTQHDVAESTAGQKNPVDYGIPAFNEGALAKRPSAQDFLIRNSLSDCPMHVRTYHGRVYCTVQRRLYTDIEYETASEN